jgi:hypothetical protein
MSQKSGNDDDFGRMDLDPAEQADAERFLDDPSATDDEPWSPPERQPRGSELIGVETDGGETLDQRLRQEQPEPVEPERPDMVGGDDPDAIPAEEDVLGGPAAADGVRHDGSPEEQAMRVVEDDEA